MNQHKKKEIDISKDKNNSSMVQELEVKDYKVIDSEDMLLMNLLKDKSLDGDDVKFINNNIKIT